MGGRLFPKRARSQLVADDLGRSGLALRRTSMRGLGFCNPKPAALVRTAYRQCLAKVLACPKAAV
jgi:hypothetical protein